MSNTINEQIVRTQGNQVGPFTANNNRVDLILNGGQVVDMTKTYIEVELRAIITPATTDTLNNGVYDVACSFGDADYAFNVGLIKNCRLDSQNLGNLEEINRVDMLQTNLNTLTLSQAEKESLSVSSLAQSKSFAHQRYGLFTDFQMEGTTKSINKVPKVKIPMSQLFGLGKVPLLDLNKTGNLTVHIELNNDSLEGFVPTANYTAANIACQDIPISTNNLKTLDLTTTYENFEDIPYWIGQHVTVSGTATGGATFTNPSQIIIQIARLTTSGVVTLTFDAELTTTSATESFTAVLCTPDIAGSAVEISIENVAIVSSSITGVKPPEVVQYNTYTTEQMTVHAQQNFSQVVQLPPNCINYFCMFPLADTFRSAYQNAKQYRNRLDNEQETSRPVQYYTPLYYEQLRRTLVNAGMKLKDLNKVTDVSNAFPTGVNNQNFEIVANAVNQTVGNKILQLNIDSTTVNTGVTSINIYKQISKQL